MKSNYFLVAFVLALMSLPNSVFGGQATFNVALTERDSKNFNCSWNEVKSAASYKVSLEQIVTSPGGFSEQSSYMQEAKDLSVTGATSKVFTSKSIPGISLVALVTNA
eukprot:825184_1